MSRTATATALVLVMAAGAAFGLDETGVRIRDPYREVVLRTVGMVNDPHARELAGRRGLEVLNLTWEDTGRYKNSAVGPNISDMTIQVQLADPRASGYSLHCMPVIRFPNFSDKSADVPLDRFYLLVGNETGRQLRRVTLRDFLGDMRRYLARPGSWKGRGTSLLAPRDTHVLVSAQACFLPIPERGIAEFNPVLFNYQSYEGDPAVLAILVTREGTSATVIDNKRDAFRAGRTWGQRLFFNQNGERASLTGKRMSDFLAGDEARGYDDGSARAGSQEGLNMVLLIQVPLKQRRPRRDAVLPMLSMDKFSAAATSDVEEAVIGHGRVEGPFTEIDDLKIERDGRFPIRVTVQFYKATSNGAVSENDMAQIAAQIGRVYEEADYVGSLVTAGPTGRPTEYDGDKVEPPYWWDDFWRRHERNTGQSREEAMRILRRLLGPRWFPRSRDELVRELEKAGQTPGAKE